MQLIEVTAAWRAVSATSSRTAKTAIVADVLRAAGPGIAVVVPWLGGELRQRRTGIGWASLRDAPPPAAAPTLTVRDVDDAFERVSRLAGAGSATERRRSVSALFAAATADEQAFLRALISGELRQGALDAVVVNALARVAGVGLPPVRRAVMVSGAIAPVAQALLSDGPEALGTFRLEVGRPLQPMLAATAESVPAALASHGGEASVEAKLDGIRVQVHRSGDDVAVYSRSLDDITARVPEIVTAVRRLPAGDAIIDGEALAVGADGRPLPFQQTGARAATRSRPAPVPLTLFAFDLLHVSGDDLIDAALRTRAAALAELAPALAVDRLVTGDPQAAKRFFQDQLAAGQEGVVVKALDSRYDAGRRGAAWLKVKPVRTVDLVVLAAEWGHGRRTGWLSNLHLGARTADGRWVMVGKTFKGMTDAMLREQTARFLSLAERQDRWTVHIRPEVVVEIGFDGVQRSSRYPGGVALRFARVLRYRDDKPPDQADTIETLQALLPG